MLTDKQHKLLEKAVPSTVNAAKKKGKAKVTQTAKRAKHDFLVVHKSLLTLL